MSCAVSFPSPARLCGGNTNIPSLKCLAHNTALETLDLGYCRKLASLNGIERLTGLTKEPMLSNVRQRARRQRGHSGHVS